MGWRVVLCGQRCFKSMILEVWSWVLSFFGCVFLDDVFLFKDMDGVEMDEIDREVEYFKRQVWGFLFFFLRQILGFIYIQVFQKGFFFIFVFLEGEFFQVFSLVCLLEFKQLFGRMGYLGRCKGWGEGGMLGFRNQGFFQFYLLCVFICVFFVLFGLSFGVEVN